MDAIFYDHDYQAQLARPNMDLLLQEVYRNRNDLVVVFLSADYASKAWCGLEWRVVRDIIKSNEASRVMLIRFDDSPIDGLLLIDGYLDGSAHAPQRTAELILERLRVTKPRVVPH